MQSTRLKHPFQYLQSIIMRNRSTIHLLAHAVFVLALLSGCTSPLASPTPSLIIHPSITPSTVSGITLVPAATLTATPIEKTINNAIQSRFSQLSIQLQNDTVRLQLLIQPSTIPVNAYQVFIQTAGKQQKGYFIRSIRANLLLENEGLFLYYGEGKNWKWMEITPPELSFERTENGVIWKLPLAAWETTCTTLALECTSIAVVAQIVDSQWNAIETTNVLSINLK